MQLSSSDYTIKNGKISQISGLCFLLTWWPSEGTGGMVEVGRN